MRALVPTHSPMSRLLAAATLLVPLLAACGGSSATPSHSAAAASSSAEPSAAPSTSADPSQSASAAPSAPAAALLLACDAKGPGWKSSALDGPATAEDGTAAAAKALKDYVTGRGGDSLPDTGWKELYRSPDLALYGQDDPSGEPNVLLTATIRRTDGAWNGEDAGQCRPRVWMGSSLGMAADWKLAAKASATAKTLKLLVTERACASGQSAKGRIAKPRISYGDDRIVITMGVTPLQGSQDCLSNPATPVTVSLSEALGTRTLYDGGAFPPAEVKQPK